MPVNAQPFLDNFLQAQSFPHQRRRGPSSSPRGQCLQSREAAAPAARTEARPGTRCPPSRRTTALGGGRRAHFNPELKQLEGGLEGTHSF